MNCLESVIKYKNALLKDCSEDRYGVRKEIIDKCNEIIDEFKEDTRNHYKVSYLYEWIDKESNSCSDSGHSASMFYDKYLCLLQEIRGLSPKDTLHSVCTDIIKHKDDANLPSDLVELLRKLYTFFE